MKNNPFFISTLTFYFTLHSALLNRRIIKKMTGRNSFGWRTNYKASMYSLSLKHLWNKGLCDSIRKQHSEIAQVWIHWAQEHRKNVYHKVFIAKLFDQFKNSVCICKTHVFKAVYLEALIYTNSLINATFGSWEK